MSNSLQPHELQHTRIPYPSLPPGACSNSCPLSCWCHPTVLSSASPSPPAFNLSQHQGLFQWVGSLHQVAKVVDLQPQHQSFQRIFRFDFLAVQRETMTDFIFFGYYWGTHYSTIQREELALEHSLPPSGVFLIDYFHATQIRSFLLLTFPPSLSHLEAWWIQRRPENSERKKRWRKVKSALSAFWTPGLKQYQIQVEGWCKG